MLTDKFQFGGEKHKQKDCDQQMKYYIASCGFTSRYPKLSKKVQDYVSSSYSDMLMVRCCVPGWREKEYENSMPRGLLADAWRKLPQSHMFVAEDEIWSLCPNCLNISEEWRGIDRVHSLLELIDQDDSFPFPDYSGLTVTLQDCWRMRERTETHNAVRNLLRKMKIDFLEIPNNRERADFCGTSLFRPQVARNPELAPRHYKDEAKGLFQPHSEEEQVRIMSEYCRLYQTKTVVCYCHNCKEGLVAGGMDGRNIVELLFRNSG